MNRIEKLRWQLADNKVAYEAGRQGSPERDGKFAAREQAILMQFHVYGVAPSYPEGWLEGYLRGGADWHRQVRP